MFPTTLRWLVPNLQLPDPWCNELAQQHNRSEHDRNKKMRFVRTNRILSVTHHTRITNVTVGVSVPPAFGASPVLLAESRKGLVELLLEGFHILQGTLDTLEWRLHLLRRVETGTGSRSISLHRSYLGA